MINKILATKFIERIIRYTDYNINIMDEQGIIIASRDSKRIGTFHEVAYHIINGTEDIIETTQDEDYPGVYPGINMAITIHNRREGVVGVTGDPKEIKSIALIIKMAIETMIKYEKQQEEQMRHKSCKTQFMYRLISEEHLNSAELRRMANQLNYSEGYTRVPILFQLEDTDTDKVLNMLTSGRSHGKEDISFVLSASEILIFKTLTANSQLLFSDYKYQLEDYLHTTLQWFLQEKRPYAIYVGSFQNNFSQYCYAYQHCRWLEQSVTHADGVNYFYDYTGAYMRNIMPINELQKIFQICEKEMDSSFISNYREMVGILIQTNYNLTETAKELFMHKNTLMYRYNKIKDALNVNPITSASDRYFMEALYAYFEKNDGEH